MPHPIATPFRFIYLNLWAFFLLFLGIGVALIPCQRMGVLLLVLQIILVFIIEKGAVKIFYTWEDKKRKYVVLMERNRLEFRPDTFDVYMQAPCGRLLVKLVLKDLGIPEKYDELKKLKVAFWSCKKENFRHQTVSIRFNPKYAPRQGQKDE